MYTRSFSLTNSNILIFDPKLAKLIGLPESLVIQQIHYWLVHNKGKRQNIRDGKVWTFITVQEIHSQIPVFSISTIKRALANLKRLKFIEVGKYCKNKYNRTNWYTINYICVNNYLDKNGLEKTINDPNDSIMMEQSKEETKQDNTETVKIRSDFDKWSEMKNHTLTSFIMDYLALYKELTGNEHPRFKKKQFNEVYRKLYNFSINDVGLVDYQGGIDETSKKILLEMADRFIVLTKFRSMDPTIFLFVSDNILLNQYYTSLRQKV